MANNCSIIRVTPVCGKIVSESCAGCGDNGKYRLISGLEVDKDGAITYIEIPFKTSKTGNTFILESSNGVTEFIDYDKVIGYDSITEFIEALCQAAGGGSGTGGTGGGGGPFTVDADTPTAGDITVTDTSSGESFILSTGLLNALLVDADGDTRIDLVESGAAAGGGDRMDFVVDGNVVGSVEFLAGGLSKWTLADIVDPIVFAATPVTTVQRDALPGITAGYYIYNSDTNDYEFYNGTTWISSSGAGLGVSADPGQVLTVSTNDNLHYYNGYFQERLTLVATSTRTITDVKGKHLLIAAGSDLTLSDDLVAPQGGFFLMTNVDPTQTSELIMGGGMVFSDITAGQGGTTNTGSITLSPGDTIMAYESDGLLEFWRLNHFDYGNTDTHLENTANFPVTADLHKGDYIIVNNGASIDAADWDFGDWFYIMGGQPSTSVDLNFTGFPVAREYNGEAVPLNLTSPFSLEPFVTYMVHVHNIVGQKWLIITPFNKNENDSYDHTGFVNTGSYDFDSAPHIEDQYIRSYIGNTNMVNTPDGNVNLANDNWTIRWTPRTEGLDTHGFQEVFRYDADGTTGAWVRSRIAGVWQGWQKLNDANTYDSLGVQPAAFDFDAAPIQLDSYFAIASGSSLVNLPPHAISHIANKFYLRYTPQADGGTGNANGSLEVTLYNESFGEPFTRTYVRQITNGIWEDWVSTDSRYEHYDYLGSGAYDFDAAPLQDASYGLSIGPAVNETNAPPSDNPGVDTHYIVRWNGLTHSNDVHGFMEVIVDDNQSQAMFIRKRRNSTWGPWIRLDGEATTMVGSGVSNGEEGLVPQPLGGSDQYKALTGDAEWTNFWQGSYAAGANTSHEIGELTKKQWLITPVSHALTNTATIESAHFILVNDFVADATITFATVAGAKNIWDNGLTIIPSGSPWTVPAGTYWDVFYNGNRFDIFPRTGTPTAATVFYEGVDRIGGGAVNIDTIVTADTPTVSSYLDGVTWAGTLPDDYTSATIGSAVLIFTPQTVLGNNNDDMGYQDFTFVDGGGNNGPIKAYRRFRYSDTWSTWVDLTANGSRGTIYENTGGSWTTDELHNFIIRTNGGGNTTYTFNSTATLEDGHEWYFYNETAADKTVQLSGWANVYYYDGLGTANNTLTYTIPAKSVFLFKSMLLSGTADLLNITRIDAVAGGGSILTSNEVQTANRIQDFGNFQQDWNNISLLDLGFTPTTGRLRLDGVSPLNGQIMRFYTADRPQFGYGLVKEAHQAGGGTINFTAGGEFGYAYEKGFLSNQTLVDGPPGLANPQSSDISIVRWYPYNFTTTSAGVLEFTTFDNSTDEMRRFVRGYNGGPGDWVETTNAGLSSPITASHVDRGNVYWDGTQLVFEDTEILALDTDISPNLAVRNSYQGITSTSGITVNAPVSSNDGDVLDIQLRSQSGVDRDIVFHSDYKLPDGRAIGTVSLGSLEEHKLRFVRTNNGGNQFNLMYSSMDLGQMGVIKEDLAITTVDFDTLIPENEGAYTQTLTTSVAHTNLPAGVTYTPGDNSLLQIEWKPNNHASINHGFLELWFQPANVALPAQKYVRGRRGAGTWSPWVQVG